MSQIPLLISSTVIMEVIKLQPDPPYSSGISIPINPFANNAFNNPASIFPFASISFTNGPICSCANLATTRQQQQKIKMEKSQNKENDKK